MPARSSGPNEYAAEGWPVVTGLNVAHVKTSGGQVIFVLEHSTS